MHRILALGEKRGKGGKASVPSFIRKTCNVLRPKGGPHLLFERGADESERGKEEEDGWSWPSLLGKKRKEKRGEERRAAHRAVGGNKNARESGIRAT